MAESSDIAAVGALAVTAAVGLFRELLPPLADVRRSSDAETATDVRVGEVAGTALTVGIGGVLALLLHTHEPLTLSLLIAVGLIIVWERALRMRGAPEWPQ